MWFLTIRSPASAPVEYEVKPGINTLGRKPDNQIIIFDESASRLHAEIYCENDQTTIYDLESTNGTFVNRERITKPHVLQMGDQIRIGQHVIIVDFQEKGAPSDPVTMLPGTRPLTRDLLLESIDQNAVFLDAIASRLTMIFDLEAALLEIEKLARLAVGADKCGVILADRFDQLEELEVPSAIARQAIEQRSVVIIPNLKPQSDQLKGNNVQPLIRSVLCVPVIIEQDVAAFIYAYKTTPTVKPFDQHDVQLTVAISHQAALTIQRAKLLEESRMLQQIAFTDSLTGVHNRRQILHLAALEFQRAQRFQHPLTLLVLDLDGLKQINDTYGHLVGDKALQVIAETSASQLREIDSIGRFGGDEFVILLVETDLKGGRAVAERICQSIADISINTQLAPLNITTSIGIAAISEKSSNLTSLFNQADKALIRAKKSGKNQVAVAE